MGLNEPNSVALSGLRRFDLHPGLKHLGYSVKPLRGWRFSLQLHEQNIVGQSDSLFNGWAVALLKRNFVGHWMPE